MHHKLISSRLIQNPSPPAISRSNSCSSEGSNMTTVAEDHVPLNFSLSAVVSRELGSEALTKEAEKHDEKIIQQQIQQAQASSFFSSLAPSHTSSIFSAAAAASSRDNALAALAHRQQQLQLDHLQQLQQLQAQYPQLYPHTQAGYLTPQASLLAQTLLRTQEAAKSKGSEGPSLVPSANLKRMVDTVPTGAGEPKRARRDSDSGAEDDDDDSSKGKRFRPYQSEQWTEKFQELCNFRKTKGHCQVPHTYADNPPLARWVKRQRYQYKLKIESKQSTMTDERIIMLENIGFIWDSHAAAWEEKLNELKEYTQLRGNCNVPSTFPENPQLATWVKCQRRQYKLLRDGKTSNMTLERIVELEKIGFVWEVRKN